MLIGILGDELIWSTVLWELLLVTPESCKTFLDYPCEGTLVSRSHLCVLCLLLFATSADLWDSWAAIGICCFIKGM